MGELTWQFGNDDGTITVRTEVTGRAARTGHRLTITMGDFRGTATTRDGLPVGVEATIEVDSLTVVSGEGGLTPLSGPEKMVARANALKSLDANKFGEIGFSSTAITATETGYRADGTLTIHGRSRPYTLDFGVDEENGRHRVRAQASITQSDFGIKPYSLMMGALKVADEVRVDIEIEVG